MGGLEAMWPATKARQSPLPAPAFLGNANERIHDITLGPYSGISGTVFLFGVFSAGYMRRDKDGMVDV